MSRRKRHGGERYIALPHWLLRSPAWRALSPNGKAVLLHLWERHNGTNNGQIVYAVREAAEIGITRPTAARALNKLVDLGFLKITRASAFRIKTKEAREWAITAEPIDGQPATKEFMRWTGSKIISQSHQRDAQSHQRDRDPENAQKSAVSVSPVRPSPGKIGDPQSHQRDTSSIPCEAGLAGDGELSPDTSLPALKTRRALLRFGDLAKAERTARTPRWVQ